MGLTIADPTFVIPLGICASHELMFLKFPTIANMQTVASNLRMRKTSITFIILFFVLACKQSKEQTWVSYKISQQKIDSVVDSLLDSKNILGASVGITIGDSIKYLKSFGYTDTTKTNSVQAKSIFPIASITKLITAIGILKLQEEGKLSIENSIVEYFSELPDEYSGIKVKNLLNHTSGLALMTDFTDSLRQTSGIDIRNEKIFDYLNKEKIITKPNEVWAYNNTPGYLLLSLLIERISKMDYGEFLYQYFTVPLELKNFGLCSSEPIKNNYRLSFLMNNPLAKYLDDSKIFEQLKGQGGICSSTEDLLKIMMSLQNGKLLSNSNYNSMQSKTTLSNGLTIPYGLGTRMGFSGSHFKMGHTGGAFTDFATLFHYPKEKVTIAVLTNSEPSNAPFIAERIAHSIFNLEFPEKEKIDKKIVYEGIYQWGTSTITYKIDEAETLREYIDYGDGEIDSLDYYYTGGNKFYNQRFGSEIEFLTEQNIAIRVNSFSSGLFSDSEIATRKNE